MYTNQLLRIRSQIESWCGHVALAELVTMFGGVIPSDDDLAARLAWLDRFSTVWDYRGRARTVALSDVPTQDAAGAARWLIPRLALPVAQQERIHELTRQLGLIDETRPQTTKFDYLLVIGGGRFTNRLRVEYAREVAAGCRIGRVVLAAASRHLLPSEEDAVARCAPGARTEFELLAAAAADVFGLDVADVLAHARGRADNPQRDELVWDSPFGCAGVPVTLMETPSPDPERRRATSGDTFTFAARTAEMADSTCLSVSGHPFAPFQHFDALRTMTVPFGITVETAGFGIERYNGLSPLDEQHPAKVLQEVRSTIRSARALLQRIDADYPSTRIGQSTAGM